MGRNRRKARPGSQKQNQADAVTLTRRFLDRGQYKDALKQARIAIRQEVSPVRQQLLEQASFERAAELHRNGLQEQCRDLLLPLAKSASDQSVQARLPELLLRAGLLDRFPQYRDTVSELTRNSVSHDQFDRAIGAPDQTLPADRNVADAVRQALTLVETGDDDAALERLSGIPRKSPAAEWRVFVRGLIQWYRSDDAAAEACWSRLNEARAPARIAARLQTIRRCGGAGTGADSGLVRVIERAVLGGQSLTALTELRDHVAREDWSEMMRVWQRCRPAFRKQANVLRRITDAVLSRIIDAEAHDVFDEFRCHATPPPIDPRWHRTRALLDEPEDQEDAEEHWLQYLAELNSIPAFTERERPLVRSLVHARMAAASCREIDELVHCSCSGDHSEEIECEYEFAIEHLSDSLEACPENERAWTNLIGAHELTGHSSEASRTAQRMLEHFPNDLQALRIVGGYELTAGDPFKARDCLHHAHRLRPLDKSLCHATIAAHSACLRRLIEVEDLSAARRELEAVDVPLRSADIGDRAEILTLRAVLEFQSSDEAAGELAVQAVCDSFEEATAALLHLVIEFRRAGLAETLVAGFETMWKSELKRRCHAQTASEMTRLMFQLKQRKVPHRFWKSLVPDLLAYIRRTSRVKFQAEELLNVCGFLQLAGDQQLLKKFVVKGRKKFPQTPTFHFLTGILEVGRESLGHQKRALASFRKVIELCEGSSDHSHDELLKMARRKITLLKSPGRFLQPPPFGPAMELDEMVPPTVDETVEMARDG
jgi:tetratricopeptide (TPR) repeat protein